MKRFIAIICTLTILSVLPLAAQGKQPGDSGGQAGQGTSKDGGQTRKEAEAGEQVQDGAGALEPKKYELKDARGDLARLKLKTQERERIRELLEKDEPERTRIRAELKDLQKNLVKLMLGKTPDREGIRATVRESVELEFRLRMIQVNRQLALRELLGDERWAALYRLSRAKAELDGFLREKLKAEEREAIKELLKLFKYLD